jgi:hypothetical protein
MRPSPKSRGREVEFSEFGDIGFFFDKDESGKKLVDFNTELHKRNMNKNRERMNGYALCAEKVHMKKSGI